jgi:hypothetical protein
MKGIKVWVSRDARDGVLMFFRRKPMRGRDYFGRGHGFMFDAEGAKRKIRQCFGVRVGQCKAFVLTPAREKGRAKKC